MNGERKNQEIREKEREIKRKRHRNRFRFMDLNVDIDFKNIFYALSFSGILIFCLRFLFFTLSFSSFFHSFFILLPFSLFSLPLLSTFYKLSLSGIFFGKEREEEEEIRKKKGIKNEIFLHKILLNFLSESETRRKEECDNLHVLPSSLSFSLTSIFSPIFCETERNERWDRKKEKEGWEWRERKKE